MWITLYRCELLGTLIIYELVFIDSLSPLFLYPLSPITLLFQFWPLLGRGCSLALFNGYSTGYIAGHSLTLQHKKLKVLPDIIYLKANKSYYK